jgi:hypothetical protein
MLQWLSESASVARLGCAGKQPVEPWPVTGKGWPEFIAHGEGDVLPFAVGLDMPLFGNSLLGGLHTAGATAFAFTAAEIVFGVRAMR